MAAQLRTRLRAATRGSRFPVYCAVLLVCAGARAQKDEYIGAQACGACHPEQIARQATSAHAKALSPAGEHALAAAFSSGRQVPRPPYFHLQFRLNGNEMRAMGSDAKDVMDIPVDWAFGAGQQAVTFVTRVNEDWYLEHYLSYYSAGHSFAPTPGQDAVPAKTLAEAMGVLYKPLDPDTGMKACFECHSTGPVLAGPAREIHPTELGVRCEACHGPGRAHRDAVASGKLERARNLIRNPSRMSASELNHFCGMCHRQPASPGAVIDWSVAWNLRHEPIYLSQSACFRKSAGALSCLTCHDPHDQLQQDDASYNARCQSCHSQAGHPAVNQGTDCVACHMPRVSPQAYLRFTNHWIGVYSAGAKLKPSR